MVLAKLVVHTGAGLVYGVLGGAVALAATGVGLNLVGGRFSLSDGQMWRTLIGCVIWNVLFAAVGVAVGALIRNLAGAIAAALAWVAIIEGVVGQLIGTHLSRWLPVAAGSSLGDVSNGGPALPQWAGGLVLAVYTVVLAALALSFTVGRDV